MQKRGKKKKERGNKMSAKKAIKTNPQIIEFYRNLSRERVFYRGKRVKTKICQEQKRQCERGQCFKDYSEMLVIQSESE